MAGHFGVRKAAPAAPGNRGMPPGFGFSGSLFHKKYGALLAGDDGSKKNGVPAHWERPVDEDEKPREKLRKVRGTSAKGNKIATYMHFGAGNCRAANLESGKAPSSPDRKKDRKDAGICGPYIKKDDKEKEEGTCKKKIIAFADEGTVFADIKNPEKNLDPDTEEGQRSRRNILKWLKVYSENAAECTRRQNDAVLFS